MPVRLPVRSFAFGFLLAGTALALPLPVTGAKAQAPATPTGQVPHILQQPSMSRDLIAFSYAGDLWVVARAGGRATRLTTGIGIESAPILSPDGRTIAFTGEYDGNVDVFTIPATGGIPQRVTWHPGADAAVGWSRDGSHILFRSAREASSRYAKLYTVAASGGIPQAVPLPMAYAGQYSPEGDMIAYSPLAPAFGFNFNSYVSWGNYRGGRAGVIKLTTLPGLDTVEIPHGAEVDFSPVFLGGKVYFLSARAGRIGIFSYDPASRAVTEVYHNSGPDIRSLSTDGSALIFDRLGELYTLVPGEQPQLISIDVTGDMPDVRPRMLNVSGEVQNVAISATGVRAVVEAHGEILTVPAEHGAIRNITGSTGSAERQPAWSPDGQSIAYFSDESGVYALHIADQAGGKAVRKFPIATEPAYYFEPVWSPDSKKIAFYDNRLNVYVLDTVTGKASLIGDPDTFGGFSSEEHAMAWSPDSRWLVYPHSLPNHLHVLKLYSVDKRTSTQLTDGMANAHDPAFDRNGKYLYFLASNDSGATSTGLDMSSDLYTVTQSIYALTLAADTASPVAPESDDEKSLAETREDAGDTVDATPAGRVGKAKKAVETDPEAKAKAKPKAADPTRIDLAGLSVDAIGRRIVALPLPARGYRRLAAGKPGSIYFIEKETERFGGAPGGTLNRWTLDERKTTKLAEHVVGFELSADAEKMLVASISADADVPGFGDEPLNPKYQIVAATAPVKGGDGLLSLGGLQVKVDPRAEWAQMYHEVWRIERAYFYDPGFHGVDTVAAEKRLEPYVAAIQSRSDLNYIFQEMLTPFSVGHLRGFGGAIPSARKVPGGLLGADYTIRDNRYCIAKIYDGGNWSPDMAGPLAQPGLNVKSGDCILAIDGEPVTAAQDIQKPLEGTAGRAVTLRIGDAAGKGGRDIVVVPTGSEADLRNIDWIDGNRRKVDAMSGGRLAYVYLPDTQAGGFTAFNRYYFAQTDKQGAIIDERFNAGGQVADYIIEVLSRTIQSYWSPRYGKAEHAPGGGIYGPKVMIANEISGSGGDMLPWLFKYRKLGPLVGKRTWGGLVGIGYIPSLMDGGEVTAPSVGFFSPEGQWDVENHGVAPDYTVEQDPKLVAAGHDPQLETAVALALDQLEKNPRKDPVRPAYAVYP